MVIKSCVPAHVLLREIPNVYTVLRNTSQIALWVYRSVCSVDSDEEESEDADDDSEEESVDPDEDKLEDSDEEELVDLKKDLVDPKKKLVDPKKELVDPKRELFDPKKKLEDPKNPRRVCFFLNTRFNIRSLSSSRNHIKTKENCISIV
jgi:hypothetical protein